MKTKLTSIFIFLSMSVSAQFTVQELDGIIQMIHEREYHLEYIDSLESRLKSCEYIRSEMIKHDLEQRKTIELSKSTIDLLWKENVNLELENNKAKAKLKRRNRLVPIVGVGSLVVGGVLVWLIK